MDKEIELLIRKSVLKELEIWLYKQYSEIDNELIKLREIK